MVFFLQVTCIGESLFIKQQACNFIKKRLQHRFPLKLCSHSKQWEIRFTKILYSSLFYTLAKLVLYASAIFETFEFSKLTETAEISSAHIGSMLIGWVTYTCITWHVTHCVCSSTIWVLKTLALYNEMKITINHRNKPWQNLSDRRMYLRIYQDARCGINWKKIREENENVAWHMMFTFNKYQETKWKKEVSMSVWVCLTILWGLHLNG